jgi:hypothetical protein
VLTRYFLDTDDDGHWYLVPVAKRDDWSRWRNIPSEDERSWEAPGYAKRLGGVPNRMTFADPEEE